MLVMNEQGIIAAGQDKNLYLCDWDRENKVKRKKEKKGVKFNAK